MPELYDQDADATNAIRELIDDQAIRWMLEAAWEALEDYVNHGDEDDWRSAQEFLSAATMG